MGQGDKLLARMRANPRDWRMADVETVARAHGLTSHKPGGSHVTLRHQGGAMLTIPAHRPIKAVYIKLLVELLDSLEEGRD